MKLKVLLHPALPVQVKGHLFFNFLVHQMDKVFHHSAFAYTLIAVMLIFFQSLYLNNIVVRHRLFHRNTYLPAFVYLLITSAFPKWNYFCDTIIINWLLLISMDVMFEFSKTPHPRKLIYNAALLLCVVGLFQLTGLGFFVFLIVGLILFRSFNPGEWSVALLGYATPAYFLASILFLFDRLHSFKNWLHVGFSIEKVTTNQGYFAATMGGLAFLFLSGVLVMRQNVTLSNIYIRRNWMAITFYLIIAILVAFATDKEVSGAWTLVLPPAGIMMSHAYALERHKKFSVFVFYFSLIFIGFCLWANK